MFPYKVYYHRDGFKDEAVAAFLDEFDAEDWAIEQNAQPQYPRSSDYYVKKYEE